MAPLENADVPHERAQQLDDAQTRLRPTSERSSSDHQLGPIPTNQELPFPPSYSSPEPGGVPIHRRFPHCPLGQLPASVVYPVSDSIQTTSIDSDKIGSETRRAQVVESEGENGMPPDGETKQDTTGLCDALEARIKEMVDREVAEQGPANQELEQRMLEQEEKYRRLERRMDEKENGDEGLNWRMTEKEEQDKKMKQKLNTQARKIRNLMKRTAIARDAIETLPDLRKQVTDIQALESQLETQDEAIENLESQLRGQDTDIQDLESRLRTQDTAIENLESQLWGQDTILQAFESQLRTQDTTIETMKSQLREQDRTIKDLLQLRKQVADIQALESQLREQKTASDAIKGKVEELEDWFHNQAKSHDALEKQLEEKDKLIHAEVALRDEELEKQFQKQTKSHDDFAEQLQERDRLIHSDLNHLIEGLATQLEKQDGRAVAQDTMLKQLQNEINGFKEQSRGLQDRGRSKRRSPHQGSRKKSGQRPQSQHRFTRSKSRPREVYVEQKFL